MHSFSHSVSAMAWTTGLIRQSGDLPNCTINFRVGMRAARIQNPDADEGGSKLLNPVARHLGEVVRVAIAATLPDTAHKFGVCGRHWHSGGLRHRRKLRTGSRVERTLPRAAAEPA